MNDNAKKWLAALRSGEYDQGRGVLTRVTEGQQQHCCLGVACQLYLEENPDFRIEMHHEPDGGNILQYGRVGNTGVLPSEVRDWLGLMNDCGLPDIDAPHNFDLEPLTNLNDKSVPFEEIADILEQNERAYFGNAN